jgi:hypothetical protein
MGQGRGQSIRFETRGDKRGAQFFQRELFPNGEIPSHNNGQQTTLVTCGKGLKLAT